MSRTNSGAAALKTAGSTPPPLKSKRKDSIAEPKLTDEQILLGEHHLRELGIEQVIYEHYFCENRDWRFDIYLPEHRIGIEIHGGQFTGGHRRGVWGKKESARRRKLGIKETPQEEEYNKLNMAQMDGIRVFQFSNEQVNDARAKEFLGGIL